MRMDERLMQVLRAANGVLAHNWDSSRRRLAAKSFAITPLGPRLGLLQWVEDTMPLFQVGMTVPGDANKLQNSCTGMQASSCQCWPRTGGIHARK